MNRLRLKTRSEITYLSVAVTTPSILQKLKDWFNSYLTKNSSKAAEAKAIKEAVDRIDGQIKLWDEMLVDAIQNNQVLQNEGIKAQKNTTEGDVQFAVRYTENNEPVVWVEEDVLKGNKLPEHQAVANYLGEHIGEVYTIIESGQNVYLGEDLPSEYTQSEYTKKLLKAPSLLKAKHKAVAGLGEMIEIATKRKWEKAKHTHNKDAKYGVYKYKTRFAFPVYDSNKNIVGAKAFNATLVILNSSDGKKYLYDLVSIKKNTAVSTELSQRMSRPAKQVRNNGVSNNSIHQNNPKSQEQNQNSDRDTIDYSNIQEMQIELNQIRQTLSEMQNSDEFKNVHDNLSKAIDNGDVENGIKIYKEWQETSGY